MAVRLLPLVPLLAVLGCDKPGSVAADPSPDEVEAKRWPLPALAPAGWVAVPLDAGRSRVFEVDAEIDGRPVVLLLDTGATQFTLDKAAAARLGLEAYRPDGEGFGVPRAPDTLVARMPTLRIGGFTTEMVRAWVRDLSAVNDARRLVGDRPADGVVGAAFLDGHLAVIDYPQRKLYLRPPGGGHR